MKVNLEGAKQKLLLASVAVAGMVGAVGAQAQTTFDFPTAMQPVFDSTTSNATALGTKAIAAAVIVWGIYIGFRIGRKLVNKVA
ncbi:MAG: hypothetical protein QM625_12905 [Ralstonia sp.]|jgi:hypothetical protein|uniref:Uncharacterized protein n=2 Tax=Ralstonia pickettii TaxID=329 RepID=A0ABM9IJT6_RALPI|nr:MULTISPECIES: hypothetical protein [Ralstonia]MBA4014841.1 hypothetical protein [Ralstonia sp.]MBA4199436.1 hypothetical protein [Ralstonia sp.]MBA4229949.1 hypothetical protein [Ralstonia sp.]MBA4234589.1 hypothetical protein [Ralstonia sp.]MBA4278732.1 hypothetical protein [Ralstonia sp.]